MLNFSGSSLLKTLQDSSQPLLTQPFPTVPLLESRHSCYSIALVPGRKGNEISQITLVSAGQEPQIHFHVPHICMGRSHRISLWNTFQTQAFLHVSSSSHKEDPALILIIYLMLKKDIPGLKASCHVSRSRGNLQAASNLEGSQNSQQTQAGAGTWDTDVTRRRTPPNKKHSSITASSPSQPFCSFVCLQRAENRAHTP